MKIRAVMTLMLATLALPATAEVLFLAPTGFILENKVATRASPAAAWAALVNDVGKWWPADHTWSGRSENLEIQARAGGCFCERDGEMSVEHMRISFVQPGALLRMTGGLGPLQGFGMYGALDWAIFATEQGSEITLTYKVSGISPDGFEGLAPIVDKVQAQQLGGLGAYLGAPAGD